jgi:hypothetical protein
MADPQVEAPPAESTPVANTPPATTISDKDRLDYYWKHFALIADQRVKTFNFYIIVLLASFGATVGAFKQELPRYLYCLIGTGHIVVVVVFWMIEHRGRVILKIARDALCEIEVAALGSGFKPMTTERQDGWKLVTYGHAFILIFAVHLIFGILVATVPERFVVQDQKAVTTK